VKRPCCDDLAAVPGHLVVLVPERKVQHQGPGQLPRERLSPPGDLRNPLEERRLPEEKLADIR
jgi:hypothetical protein